MCVFVRAHRSHCRAWSAWLQYSPTADFELCQFYILFSKCYWAHGTFFLHTSRNLRSNHILVREFILTVSEEHPLERAVSDKCEIESFAANGLLPGRWCCRQQQSQETSELSEALLFHYTSFLSESLACFESCLAIVWPPKVVIGWNEGFTAREAFSLTFLLAWKRYDRIQEVNCFRSNTTIFSINQKAILSFNICF